MEYPHISYDDIVPRDSPPTRGNEAEVLSLLELARSVLLSQSDPRASLDVKVIAQRIAAKYSYMVPGEKLRWEKTLKEVLRRHYCFTGHTNNGRGYSAYSCDPSVDPALRKDNSRKRKATSLTSNDGDDSMPCVAESSRLPYPRQQAERSTDCQASSSTDIQKSCEDRMAVNDTVLELEVAEAYEQTSGREEDRRVFYCQKIGPCLLRRQRSDGQILTSDLVKLIEKLYGRNAEGQALRELFGLTDQDAWPETVSRATARDAINKAQLRLSGSSILDDVYPDLPNEAPAFLSRQPKGHKCPYCDQTFTRRDYRAHQIETRGTCQLELPVQLRAYLEMLHLAAEAHEDGSRQVRDESEGDAEEEEGDCHQCAKAIVPPALAAWTEEETDKFFQALRRFSRFRPDAIAEHVRTKNEIEVSALLELLEEESALVDVDGTEARAKRAPAARKMSEAWIKLEERLAEDAIIWEAFVQRAERTPSQMRDKAQKSVTARLMPFSCVQCSVRSSTICDGRRPTCARCAEKGSRCSWEQGFHLEYSNAAPLQLVQALDATFPDYRPPVSSQQAIRAEFAQSLSWHHLLYLSSRPCKGSLKARLELVWWKAASSVSRQTSIGDGSDWVHPSQPSKVSARLRQALARAFMHSEQQGIDLLEKEALFQYLRQKSEGEMALSSDLSDIIKLRALPEVTAALEELKAAVSEEKSSQARRLSRAPVKSARRWADIPIAHVPADLKDKYPELGGTHEEFQQARQQLRTVRLASDDLGQEACLFNLRTMAIFLDLYRKDTGDVSGIQQNALRKLYHLVKAHTRRVLALALSIADFRGIHYKMNRCSPAEKFVSCIEEAHLALPTRCQIPQIFKAFVESHPVVSKPGQASNQASATIGTAGCESLRFCSRGDPPSLKHPASEYDLNPVEYISIDSFEPELVVEDDQQSSEDDTAEWDSQSDSSGEEELLMADRQADAKLEEGDRLDDAIYEQKLWQTVNGSERGVSLSEDDDSHTPYYSSETDSASSDEDAAIGPGRSETDSEEDRQTTGAVVASDDARPVKRTRMSSGPFAQRSTAAGFADDRRRRKSYRTKEFISTSDEEEEA